MFKKKQSMKGVAIIVPSILVVLSFVLFVVAVGFKQIPKAKACGISAFSSSTTDVTEYTKYNNDEISFTLWYDSCTSSKYTSATVLQGSNNLGYIACVHRNSGVDGGNLLKCATSCPSQFTCNSPEVYSPHNTAYSRIFDYYIDTHTSSF